MWKGGAGMGPEVTCRGHDYDEYGYSRVPGPLALCTATYLRYIGHEVAAGPLGVRLPVEQNLPRQQQYNGAG